MTRRPFLTACWRHLVMLNFTADPALLEPYVPPGTQLDFHDGRTFLSIVGFRFLNTRILGIPIPFHTNFDEVNLRFYVRRETPAGPRRGVVFIREIVPCAAIAVVARLCYGEPYISLPMRHQLQLTPPNLHARYEWRRRGHWESLELEAAGEPLAQGRAALLLSPRVRGLARVTRADAQVSSSSTLPPCLTMKVP